jgi:hypothetical protein
MPFTDTGPQWLPEQLAKTPLAWVTEDSVSMVYEALTAGCKTGILAVPGRRRGRRKLEQGLESLAADKLVTRFADWQASRALAAPVKPFNEAARVADWILDRWPVR